MVKFKLDQYSNLVSMYILYGYQSLLSEKKSTMDLFCHAPIIKMAIENIIGNSGRLISISFLLVYKLHHLLLLLYILKYFCYYHLTIYTWHIIWAMKDQWC